MKEFVVAILKAKLWHTGILVAQYAKKFTRVYQKIQSMPKIHPNYTSTWWEIESTNQSLAIRPMEAGYRRNTTVGHSNLKMVASSD